MKYYNKYEEHNMHSNKLCDVVIYFPIVLWLIAIGALLLTVILESAP